MNHEIRSHQTTSIMKCHKGTFPYRGLFHPTDRSYFTPMEGSRVEGCFLTSGCWGDYPLCQSWPIPSPEHLGGSTEDVGFPPQNECLLLWYTTIDYMDSLFPTIVCGNLTTSKMPKHILFEINWCLWTIMKFKHIPPIASPPASPPG